MGQLYKILYTGSLCIALFAASSLKAQTDLDSLDAVWNDQSKDDSLRLDARRKYIWNKYLFSSPDSAFEMAEEAFEEAKRLKRTDFMAKFANLQGISFSIRDQISKSNRYFRKSLNLSKSVNDLRGMANASNNLGINYDFQGQVDSAIQQFEYSMEVYEDLGDQEGKAIALQNIGSIYSTQGDIPKSIKYFEESIDLASEVGAKKVICHSLNNLGMGFKEQGDHRQAIQYYMRSLKLSEEINDLHVMGFILNSIGNIYHTQNEYEQAIKYFKRSLEVREKLNDQSGMADEYSNLGNLLYEKGDIEEARKSFQKSLELRTEIKDEIGSAPTYNTLGSISVEEKDYQKAADYYQKALSIYESTGDRLAIATTHILISKLYQKKGNTDLALLRAEKALSIANEAGGLERQKEATELLWSLYKSKNQSAKALKMHELFMRYRDSLKSEENQKALIRQEFKYEYEKQAAADSVKAAEAKKVSEAKIAAQNAQLKEERTQRYALFGGLALLGIFGGLMYNRFRLTKKQKQIIEAQKSEVEEAHDQLSEKNKEILDSIAYAKRIQNAILPSQRIVEENLKQSFILYKPKDVVAGDFYWLETVEETVYFAAADCTGHGVPGAMVSVICVNGLNRALREFELRDPAEILNKTRELVIEEFVKSEEDVKDGMDIALCAMNGQQLQYAGAHNPLWIVRNVKQNGELKTDNVQAKTAVEGDYILYEIKADKQPIGKFDLSQPFTSHQLELVKGDNIYIFSDGYADQFGGAAGKKFKSTNFKRLILSMQKEKLSDQKKMIDDHFENWRGEEEQLDDVVVIGVGI